MNLSNITFGNRLGCRNYIAATEAVLVVLVLISPIADGHRLSSLSRSFDSPKLKVAVAGFVHSHGYDLLKELQENPGVELVGIADSHEDIRKAVQGLAPGVAVFADYRQMLDQKKPFAVWSFVENSRHLEVTRECARRGINVVFEKPMAATYEQARQMLELARAHHIKLMVNYQMAWWPENYTAHDIAEKGDLGKVWRVRAIIGHGGPRPDDNSDVVSERFWEWLNDESLGGGALLDFTCYGAVWLRWYLGMPKSVYAITTHTRPATYQTNTNATVLAAFPGNGVGIIEGSWDLPRSFQDVEVFGNKGSIFMKRHTVEETVGRDARQVQAENLPAGKSDPITYFINCVRTGQKIEGMVSPEFNVDVMRIVEAAKESARTGRPVALAQTVRAHKMSAAKSK